MATTTVDSAALIAANLRNIMQHEAKPNPKPMSSTSVTRGFEARAFPKIVRELGDPQLIVRQKSLLAARELLSAATGYVQCIAAGISPAVIELLRDGDPTVRERAAGTLEYVMGKELGARDALQHGGIPQLVVCLSDHHTPVRDAAYHALIEAARFDAVRHALCQEKALVHLMKLALQEQKYTLTSLKVLNACVQMRHNEGALEQLIEDAEAIPSLTTLLSSEQQAVQEQAAQLLGLLTSRFFDAKVQAVKVGAVPKLVVLLQSSAVHVQAAAATALMTITVSREGKYALLEGPQGVVPLISLLKPNNEQLCVNVMEIITNVAEAPEVRPMLAEAGAAQLLQGIHTLPTATEMLKHSAAQAMRQCGFKHLPFSVLPGRHINLDEEGNVRTVYYEAQDV